MTARAFARGLVGLLALQLACAEPEPSEAPGPEVAPEAQAPSAPEPVEPRAVPAPAAAPAPTLPPPVVTLPEPEPPPPPAPPALDLDALERRLKQTKALGVLTKLALKNEIDDLIEDVEAFHDERKGRLAALRERFDLLVLKLTSLLQDEEPELAREIAGAREGLWRLLADPVEFAKLSA